MFNTFAISDTSRQIGKACLRVESLSMGIEQFAHSDAELTDTYTELLLDEVMHIQKLALQMTRFVSLNAESDEPAENTDECDPVVNNDEGGSVFAQGELDSDNQDTVVETEPVIENEGGEEEQE